MTECNLPTLIDLKIQMSIKPISKLGSRHLASPSLPVEQFACSELFDLIQDMHDTMRAEGGVGIAAPQIACNKRVILFGFDENKRYPDQLPIPLTVLINPVLTVLTDEMSDDWEGCLSVPGLRGLVPRYTNIRYDGYDPLGKCISRVVAGFHARVVQHEYDHLEGILFPQRIKDLRFFGFEDALNSP